MKNPILKPKILAIIPARGGSKRLPNKHLKDLCGKSLLQWTIDQALKSKLIDRIMVNTDSFEIQEFCKDKIEVFRRSKEVSGDKSVYDVIFEQLDYFPEYDVVVLLEPTSPLRKDDDIDKAIQLFLDNYDKADSLVSVGEIQLENPKLVMIQDGNFIRNVCNWIWVDDAWDRNYYFPYGVVYTSKVETLKKYKSFYQERTIPYFIERWQNAEINDEFDFKCIEAIMKWRNF